LIAIHIQVHLLTSPLDINEQVQESLPSVVALIEKEIAQIPKSVKAEGEISWLGLGRHHG
jgi:hypothetical protein